MWGLYLFLLGVYLIAGAVVVFAIELVGGVCLGFIKWVCYWLAWPIILSFKLIFWIIRKLWKILMVIFFG